MAKGKGSGFERVIAEQLSNWFTCDKCSVAFWRTSGSGARATNRRKGNRENNLDDFGDIKADDPIGKPFTDFFCIELKTGYAKKSKSKAKKFEGKEVLKVVNWDLLDYLDSTQKKTQFTQFWEQCEADALNSKKEPLLIFRRNNKQPCIAMYSDIFDCIIKKIGFPEFEFMTVNFNSEEFCYPQITICNLYKFFEWTKGKIKPSGKDGKYTCNFINFHFKRVLFNRYRGI